MILGAIRETPSVRKALIEQAGELRMFRDIATLRTVPLERPPDRPTDYAGGSKAAAEIGMGRLAKRLGQRRGSARLSRSKAVSPTQWAAPTAIGMSTRLEEPLGGAVGARAVGGGQQREQLVGLPAHEHVGVAQAAASSGAIASAVPSGTTIRTSAKSRP